MRKYLLPENGNFYKANMHCHTVCSDGMFTPEKVKETYVKRGYSIVAFTDHDVFIPHDELTDEGFLALHGYEMEMHDNRDESVPRTHRKACHVCLVALDKNIKYPVCWNRTKYFLWNKPEYVSMVEYDDSLPNFEREHTPECINEIVKTAHEHGFFITYNHPGWSLEDYSDYMNYNGFDALEILNGEGISEGYDDYSPRVYDDMLRGGKHLYCIGGDDNHNEIDESLRGFDSGLAFTMIKAPELNYEDIASALKNGDFYASEKPEIYALWYESGKVHIECSPADRIVYSTAIRNVGTVFAENGVPVTEAEFDVKDDVGYFRLTVIDERGRKACTNAYFLDELNK